MPTPSSCAVQPASTGPRGSRLEEWSRSRTSTRALSSSASATAAPCGLRPWRARHPCQEVLERVRAEPAMAGKALAAAVSTPEPYTVGRGATRIAVLDYGCKRSIVRRLVWNGAGVKVYPHDTPADTILGERPDAVLLSNGPGDPAPLAAQVAEVARLLGRVPLLGICLGHQLLALAAGLRELQASVRPPRCQPSRPRARERTRPRHVPESRLCRARERRGSLARLPLRRNRGGTRAPVPAGALGAIPS